MNKVEAKDDPELVSQRSESTKAKEAYAALLRSPGWAMLSAIVNAQIAARVDQIMLRPVHDGEGAAQEYMKGEVSGLKLILKYPEIELAQHSAVVEMYNDDSE